MPKDHAALGRALARSRGASDHFDRFLLALLALVAIGLIVFRAVLFTLILAAIVAYLLHPLVTWLAARRVPRWAATLLSYVLLIGGIVGFVLHVIPKVEVEAHKIALKMNTLLDGMPALVESLDSSFDSILSVLPGEERREQAATPWGSNPARARERDLGFVHVPDLPAERLVLDAAPGSAGSAGAGIDVVRLAEGHYRLRLGAGLRVVPADEGYVVRAVTPAEDMQGDLGGGFRERLVGSLQDSLVGLGEGLVAVVVSGARSVVTGVLSLVFGIFVVLMAAAYTLIDAPGMVRFVEHRFPLRRREGLRELLGLFDQGMRGVVRGQVMICLVNGLLSLIGFSWLIPEYALILALVAGVLSFIPIFGTVISSLPAVLVGLSVDFETALLVLGWILLIHFLEAYILNPKIIGREAHIHPVIVVVAVVAGERVFGVPGAFLAVPTAAALKALIVFAYRRSGASGAA